MTASTTAQLRDMIRLMTAPGAGAVRLTRLIRAFGTPSAVMDHDYHEIMDSGAVSSRAALWISGKQWDESAVDEQMEAVRRSGATPVYLWDNDYPPYLAQIYDPPPVLFVRGQVEALGTPCVAVVGTRGPSPGGRNNTRELVAGIAGAGYTVVSGMARGIDSEAHRSALDSGGHTVAVLGCGVDVLYPPENSELAVDIIGRGCLVSEYPMGTPPESRNFPRRNRLISGLSLGVLVVEAGLKSGALLTAGYALDQDRDVWAVPGDPRRPSSEGVNQLIQQGAKLVASARDVLVELGHSPARASQGESLASTPVSGPVLEALSAEERRVFEGLSREPLHVDELAGRLGMDVSPLLGVLLRLAMKQLVREHPGKLYSLC